MKPKEIIVRFPETRDCLTLRLDPKAKFHGFKEASVYTLTYVTHLGPDEDDPNTFVTSHSEYYLEAEHPLAICALNARLLSESPWRESPFDRPLECILQPEED